MKFSATMYNAQQGHSELLNAWNYAKPMLMAGNKLKIKIEPETRSTEQNSRLWAMLTEVSNQVNWYGKKLTPEDWKCVFTASLKKQNAVPGIDGGFVVLGQATSKMTVAEMSELQTLIEAFGADKGVIFNDQSREAA